MSELKKFLFDGMPVRGHFVRLDDAWQTLLARRQGPAGQDAYPPAVTHLLGQMTAAAVLMQSSIRFDGSLILQIQGDGPLKLAVVEVQSDLRFRSTASLKGEVTDDASMAAMLNVSGQARCAITLDPHGRRQGQQAYQGVAALVDASGRPLQSFSAVIEHYMRQSEQLDTVLMLTADHQVAAGLMLQRMPVQGQSNLSQGRQDASETAELVQEEDDFERLRILTRSLKTTELLQLDAQTVLKRLFWQEPLRVLEHLQAGQGPRFSCSCSRERVSSMLQSLGQQEVEDIVKEQGAVDVTCEFCGQQEHFDAPEALALFAVSTGGPPALH